MFRSIDPSGTAGRMGARSNQGLIATVYDELRALARKRMAHERFRGSLQPTELVHEVFVRMAHSPAVAWRGRTHFLAIAATQMRRVLVERARAALTQKRGERPTRISFTDDIAAFPAPGIEILSVDEALQRIGKRFQRRARIAELRVFAGMTIREIGEAVGVSEKTVRADWKKARVTLTHALLSPDPDA